MKNINIMYKTNSIMTLDSNEVIRVASGVDTVDPCYCFCEDCGYVKPVPSPKECWAVCERVGYPPDKCVTFDDAFARTKIAHYYIPHIIHQLAKHG